MPASDLCFEQLGLLTFNAAQYLNRAGHCPARGTPPSSIAPRQHNSRQRGPRRPGKILASSLPEAPGWDPAEVEEQVEAEYLSWCLDPLALEANEEYRAARAEYDEERMEAILEAHLDGVLAEQPRITAVK